MRYIPGARRHGFTRADLAAVSGTMVMIALLFLPACAGIGGVRDAAARTQCQNNLKMMCLAIHDYASTYRNQLPCLSSAPTDSEVGIKRPDREDLIHPQSILFTLLPYIERDNMYKAGMSVVKTWTAPIIGGTIELNGFVKEYVCPSDTSNSTTRAVAQYLPTATSWVGSSYAANQQVFGPVARTAGPDTKGNTANVYAAVYNIGNIPDGTSNTVFIGERFAQAGTGPSGIPNAWADPPANDALCGGNPLCGPVFAYTLNAGNPATDPLGRTGIGQPLPYTGPAGTVKYVYPGPEIGKTPQFATPGSAQSQHAAAAVVQVCMGDGSARGVSAAVSHNTWLLALQPNDGQPLGSDW